MSVTSSGGAEFTRRVAVTIAMVLAVGLLLVFVFKAAGVLLLLFGAVLLAVFFDGVASSIAGRTPLPRLAALGICIVVFLGGFVVLFWAIGPQVATQVTTLGEILPDALDRGAAALERYAWGRSLLARFPEPGDIALFSPELVGPVTRFFSGTATLALNVIVLLALGIYFAIAPQTYVKGLVKLIPPAGRRRGVEVAAALGHVLRRWIAGRLASMLVVGVLTVVGLLLAGVPLALALALIAALASFVPYIGPVLGAVPAILVALTDDPVKALYVILVFAVVQILENYLITPQIDQKAVSLPPALLIGVQILMGVLLGAGGVLMATPLLVVVVVLVQMLYLQGVLGDSVRILGSARRTGS